MMKVLPKICDWLYSRIGTQPYATMKDMYKGIGPERSGWIEAINVLLQRGVLVNACQVIPTHIPWSVMMTYGFHINFQLLTTLNW